MATYDDNDQRVTTEQTHGVWTGCDFCGTDWWCTVAERDYLDEPVSWICSDGCDDPDEPAYDDDYESAP
jgi:hypothetical protein